MLTDRVINLLIVSFLHLLRRNYKITTLTSSTSDFCSVLPNADSFWWLRANASSSHEIFLCYCVHVCCNFWNCTLWRMLWKKYIYQINLIRRPHNQSYPSFVVFNAYFCNNFWRQWRVYVPLFHKKLNVFVISDF